RAATQRGEPCKRLATDAADAMLAYGWPGNVRELENALERAVILSEGDVIELVALPERITDRKAEPLVSDRPKAATRVAPRRFSALIRPRCIASSPDTEWSDD